MYIEERLFKGDGHDSLGHSSTPWENAIILVRRIYNFQYLSSIRTIIT
jgi:hypothetical protein